MANDTGYPATPGLEVAAKRVMGALAGAERTPSREKPTITVTVEGGLIANIEWPDELKGLFRVLVVDMDDPDPERDDYRTNGDGDEWHETIWED